MRALTLLVVFLSIQIDSPAIAQTLIVLNKAEASASLIDLTSRTEVARVGMGEGPHEVAVSPSGEVAVGCNYGVRGAAGNSLTVFDIPNAKIIKTISLGKYKRPHGIQWFSDGRRVAVTSEESKALLIVDIDKGEVLHAIETNQEISHMVVLAPDETRAFVANIGSGSMTVIDLQKAERISSIPTGEGAEGIDITPDGKFVWVTNRAANTVSVIDAQSLKIVHTVSSSAFPIRAKATPDGNYMLVTNARSGELAVFDCKTYKEHKRLKMDFEAADTEGRLFGDRFDKSSVPIGVLVEPQGKLAFVAHANADVISIVDLQQMKIVGSLWGGKEPDGMAFSNLSVNKKARNIKHPEILEQ